VFNLAASQLGGAAVTIGHTLFATSIVAAMISFHGTTARYVFALARERVLPASLARTTLRGNAPRNASLTQSGIGLAVILVYAVGGWDPLIHLFFLAGTSGALGILMLITATAIAVPVFFHRDPSGENMWRRRIAPALALVALIIVLVLAVANFNILLGVPDGHPLAWTVPLMLLTIGAAGTTWGLNLRRRRPDIYAAIGLGAKAVLLANPALTSGAHVNTNQPRGPRQRLETLNYQTRTARWETHR
jgi:amino acid transporter